MTNNSDENRERLHDVEDRLDQEEGLIVEEPFIAYERRQAIREAEKARKWAEDNPDYPGRRSKKDS